MNVTMSSCERDRNCRFMEAMFGAPKPDSSVEEFVKYWEKSRPLNSGEIDGLNMWDSDKQVIRDMFFLQPRVINDIFGYPWISIGGTGFAIMISA